MDAAIRSILWFTAMVGYMLFVGYYYATQSIAETAVMSILFPGDLLSSFLL